MGAIIPASNAKNATRYTYFMIPAGLKEEVEVFFIFLF